MQEKEIVTCPRCSHSLKLEILESHKGYYLGYNCESCGPFKSISGYYKSGKEVERLLKLYIDVEFVELISN